MRVLLVASRPLAGQRRGDQLRGRQIAAALAAEQVTVLEPGSGWQRPSARQQAVALGRALLTARPLQTAVVPSPDLVEQVRRLAPEHDLVVVMLARLGQVIPACGSTPVLIDLVDALSLNAASRARVEAFGRAFAWRREARTLASLEREIVAAARRATVVCERDRRALAETLGSPLAERVDVVPLAIELPSRPTRGNVPRRIVLSGNLGYFVNHDAVLSFLGGPWTTLVQRGFELVVAGDRPTTRLAARIGSAGAQLERAPEDLAAVVATASVAVAPTRCGAGVPVKVLEAWALGVPVVASPFAAAGADLVDGETGLIADSTEEWIRAIERLERDRALRSRLTRQAREQIVAVHAPARVAARWRQIASKNAQNQ
jgi:glycosyltransferase involved in cell wall biosynthesis